MLNDEARSCCCRSTEIAMAIRLAPSILQILLDTMKCSLMLSQSASTLLIIRCKDEARSRSSTRCFSIEIAMTIHLAPSNLQFLLDTMKCSLMLSQSANTLLIIRCN
uniref:Uncharacterized protein n=1 Tax=Cucumis melo TaxID=3656 RepID=A0A9I9EDM3_CUCME